MFRMDSGHEMCRSEKAEVHTEYEGLKCRSHPSMYFKGSGLTVW